jgi:hypothetical protein
MNFGQLDKKRGCPKNIFETASFFVRFYLLSVT